MAVNTMTFNQLATVLNSIVSQATGTAQITPTDTASFVSLAKVGLETGYDPLMSAISQVLSKTIFATRPYTAKFKGLKADAVRYGNHVRKINILDNDWENDNRLSLTDGQSVDQQTVKKPKVLMTSYYGENVVSDHVTLFKDQLDVAFSGPEEFGQFISAVMQNISDRIEQKNESMARMTIANMIAAKTVADPANVIYLFDEYEDETGVQLSISTYKDPDKFPAFAKWLSGYLRTLTDLMSERSAKFHQNFTIGGVTKNIMRHTPADKLKCYLYAREINAIDTNVLADVFHEGKAALIDHENVAFWQSIDSPMGVSVSKAGYTTSAGAAAETGAIALQNVFGIIFDEDAIGYTTVNEWSAPSPFNANGGYTNMWWHHTYRYYSDLSENCVVLLLDNASA